MNRRNIGFLVFMLVVGFSVVSAALVVNGNTNISFDDTNFTSNVVFTNVKTGDGKALINGNEQNIDFETKKLEKVGDIANLHFEVSNKSREYDASVEVNCGLKNKFASFNDYFEITTNIVSPFNLPAGKSKTGKLTIKLASVYTGTEAMPELECRIIASPTSRESIGDIYKDFYKEVTLNGADPILDNGQKLVPITIDDDGTAKYADEREEWYNYASKKWANAIILVENPSKEYNVNDIIEENDIESYFVWIPRFRYQIFNKGNYTDIINSSPPSESIAKEIQIIFEGKDTEISTGSEVGEWLTHPAFTNYGTNGLWVGKFETGYKGATSTSSSQIDSIDAGKVIIKPNVYAWRNIRISKSFKTSLAYDNSLNSHMMRNTEWGAVAYLSHSKYGINDEVRINNNSNYLTGYAANEKDGASSTTDTSPYNTKNGYLASTTGNISGIYDMNGGSWEYVAGYLANTLGSSSFTAEDLVTYSNQMDIYNANSSVNTYNYRILGDATGEMGPFYLVISNYRNNWYGDYSHFIDPRYSWFLRGGTCAHGSIAGVFTFTGQNGAKLTDGGFRITLAF